MSDALDRGVVLIVQQLRRSVPGGIGIYASSLISGLMALEEGERPPLSLLASATGRTPDPLAAYGVPVTTSRLPGPLLTRAWDHGRARYREPAGLVHALSLAAPVTTAPLVVTIHDLGWRVFPEAYPPRGRRWHEAALGRVARRATHFVTPSQAVAAQLVDAGLGIDVQAITVIEHGADHLPAPDREATEALLAERGITGEFLLSVGTLEPRKNLSRLFDVYDSIRDRLPSTVPLLVVGPPGWGVTPGTSHVGIHLLGAVSGPVLAGLYARARAFAYVPLLEGFGLPVVEAMMAGVPVCSSPVPSAQGATELVDPLEIESIAEGLVTVLTDGIRRDELIEAGRRRVSTLTWVQTARSHLACWHAVARR